jgi:hypothetical protein
MKSKVYVILLVILIFLLGGVAGFVGTNLYRDHMKQVALKAGRPRFDYVEALAKELKLDPEQKQSLRLIIDESRKRYKELGSEFKPKFELITNDSNQKITSILRDDQKTLFENFLTKIRQFQQKSRPQDNAKK